MAATVNARDVQLQAASPRVLATTMASNIIVSQDNVSGLGLVVAGTKMVQLTASAQVFQVAKTGTVSPASTVLSAELRNLTSTPAITVTSGTITSPLTLVGGKLTINNTALTTDAATLRLTVVQDGVTYTDEITIVKVREGTDALVGFLTNENHNVPADYLGNVTNYGGASGVFKVFAGVTDVTSQCTFAIQAGGNPSALTVSLGATTGAFSITGGLPSGTEVTTLTLTATFGSAVLVKVFTLSKTRLPALARFIDLQASSQVFQVLKVGSVNPASVTFTARSNGLAGTPVFTVTPAGATITSAPGSSVCNITYANMGANESVAVTVTQDGLSDVVTVVKVREGVDGNEPVTGYLTNEASLIPTNSAGTNGDYTTAGGSFKVFQGIVDKTGNGVTYSVVSSSGVSLTLAQTGVYTVTGMSANSGSALLRAVFGGVTIDKVYTIAKSIAGAAGANGTNGTNGTNGVAGPRGSRTFYVPLAGGTNTFSDSLATTTASVEGGPVMNDLVVQYNSSVGFSQSKFYQITNSVGSWAIVNAVVDGNLLVSGTVGAQHIQANTFTADNAVTRGLTVRDINGNIILSSGQALDYTRVGGTKPPSNATNGADITNLNVGIGSGNFLFNAGPYIDSIEGYVVGFNNTGKTPNPLSPSYSPWRPTGQGGVHCDFPANATPAIGTICDINSGNIRYSVTAGQRYEASAYLSTHRCAGYINIAWFDNAGTYISESGGNSVSNSYAQGQLSGWPRSVLFATAPGNSATATVYVRSVYDGGVEPHTFASMWYFGAALAAQTTPSPWSDGVGANWSSTVVGSAAVNTSVTAAQAAANAANAVLADIASDGILTKGEKPVAILQYNTLANEQASVRLAASTANVSYAEYDSAILALQVYLGALSPQWDDASFNTNIVGATFRQRFIDVGVAKQALLSAVAAKTSGRLATRPNLVYNGGFENGFNGWIGNTSVLAISDSTWGRTALGSNFSGTGVISQNNSFVVQPGDSYTITGDSVLLNATGGGIYFDIEWLDVTGTSILGDSDQTVVYTNHDFATTDVNRNAHAKQVVAPANAYRGRARFVWEGITGTSVFVGCRQVKVERGTLPATQYSADATLPVLQANANTAKTAADTANAAIFNISSDNVLSMGEKSAVGQEFNSIVAEFPQIQAQSNSLSIGTGAARVNFDASVSALQNYIAALNPALTSLTTDTPIDGPTFRQRFVDYYYNKQILLNAIATKAATLATWAGVDGAGKPEDNATVGANWATNVVGAATVNSNITAAQNAANNAQTDATIANTAISNISSDNVLSKGEKSSVIAEYTAISQEYPGIQAQAASIGVSATSFNNAIIALQNYLNSTVPTWNNVSVDTPIDGPTFRLKFTDYYAQRQEILNTIAANTANRLKTRLNLVYNGGFENGFNGWTGNTGSLAVSDGVWGRTAVGTSVTGTGVIASQVFSVQAGQTYTITADSLLLNATSGVVYLDIQWLNGSGVVINDSGQGVISASHDFSEGDTNRLAHAIGVVAPAGATGGRARFVWESVVGSALVGVRQIKVERGSLPATPYSADATLPVLQANANAAQVAADTANNAIANIASDNVLAKGEKGAVILEYQTITAEYPGIQSQAAALGVSMTDFNTSISALQNYLAGLTNWNNVAVDTTIDGPTFRQKFIDYYYNKQVLLNAIAAKAATLSTWSGVTGAGKPADNATVGATFGSNISGKITSATASTFIEDAAIKNAQIGTLDATKINTGYLSADRIQAGLITADKLNIGAGRNLLKNSTWLERDLTQGLAGGVPRDWRADYSSASPSYLATPAEHPTWCPIGMQGVDLYQGSGYTATTTVMLLHTLVSIEASKRYEFTIHSGSHRCLIVTYTQWLDAAGNQIGGIVADVPVSNDEQAAGGQSLASFRQIGHFGVAPASAVQARFYIEKRSTKQGYIDSHAFLVAPMVAEATASQTVFSSYSSSGLGTKVTGAGIETNSITASNMVAKTITAASGVIGDLAVDTLQIAGQAVTVPGYAAGPTNDLTYSYSLSGQAGVAYSVLIQVGLRCPNQYKSQELYINGVSQWYESVAGGTLLSKSVVVYLTPGIYNIRAYNDDPAGGGASIFVLATKR